MGIIIDSPDWIKNKKATISPINQKDNNCFQYGVTIVLNCDKIGKNSEIIIKIESFIINYNWEKTNFPSVKDDWKKVRKNNIIITLNVLDAKKEKPYPVYVSKHNSNLEEQIILLMIPKGEGIFLQ